MHVPSIKARRHEHTGFFAPPSDRAHFIIIVGIVLFVCTVGAALPVIQQLAVW